MNVSHWTSKSAKQDRRALKIGLAPAPHCTFSTILHPFPLDEMATSMKTALAGTKLQAARPARRAGASRIEVVAMATSNKKVNARSYTAQCPTSKQMEGAGLGGLASAGARPHPPAAASCALACRSTRTTRTGARVGLRALRASEPLGRHHAALTTQPLPAAPTLAPLAALTRLAPPPQASSRPASSWRTRRSPPSRPSRRSRTRSCCRPWRRWAS